MSFGAASPNAMTPAASPAPRGRSDRVSAARKIPYTATAKIVWGKGYMPPVYTIIAMDAAHATTSRDFPEWDAARSKK